MITPDVGARALAAARREGRTVDRFTATEPGLDAAWGHAVQDLDLAAREAAGQRRVGWKLGLTSAAKQRTMGIAEPIVGFLTDAMDATRPGFDVTRLVQPRVEPELAFTLAHDLDAEPPSAEAAAHLVGTVHLALELLDSRYTGYRFGLADVLADDTSAAGFVLGPGVPLGDLPDLGSLALPWTVDGHTTTVTPSAILGDPLLALVELGRHLAVRGETTPAGSVVLAGAMTDAVPLPAAVTLAPTHTANHPALEAVSWPR